MRPNNMLTIASLLCLLGFLGRTEAQLQSGQILWLSDINLDIYQVVSSPPVGQRFGQFGQDTNVPLWAATIRSIRTLSARPDFIIVTGNSVSSNLRNISADVLFVDPLEPLRAITVAMQSFEGVRSFLVLGPNDVIENVNKDRVYSTVARMWKQWIGDDVQTLAQFGYYTTQVGDGLILLALNTNLFLQRRADFSESSAEGQMMWLRGVLYRVRLARASVIIIGHTPPGMDENGLMRWGERFQEEFLDMVEQESGIIKMILFGSTHSDTFQLVTQSTTRRELSEGRFAKSAPLDSSEKRNVMLMAPSLAPWKEPNRSPSSPAFRILDYSRATGELIDIHQYFMDLTLSNQLDVPIWTQLFSYNSIYAVRPINGRTMLDVFQRLSNDDDMLSEFIDRQGAINTTKSCDSFCRGLLLCSMEFSRFFDWMQCVQPSNDEPSEIVLTSQAWVPILAGSILLLFVLCLSVYFGARAVRRLCGYKRFA